MNHTAITIDNAVSLIKASSSIVNVDQIIRRAAWLTHTKIRDFNGRLFTSIRLINRKANPFMIEIMSQGEARKLEILQL